MPNQRAKGKKLKTLWLTPTELDALKKLSDIQGLSAGDFLKKELTQYIKAKNAKTK